MKKLLLFLTLAGCATLSNVNSDVQPADPCKAADRLESVIAVSRSTFAVAEIAAAANGVSQTTLDARRKIFNFSIDVMEKELAELREQCNE